MITQQFKLVLSCSLLLPMLYGCPKQKDNIAPIADTEVQSSVDAIYATFLISDIEMIASYIGQRNYYPDFYVPQPDADANGFNSFQSPNSNYRVAIFTNSKCVDSHERHGSVYLLYDDTNPNAILYQNFQFHGMVKLVGYRVDGWLIRTVNDTPCHIYNQLSSNTFDPSKTNLSWTIEGDFEMIHPSDASKNMTWSGKITKTLANTSDPAVYNANRFVPIDWTKAIVEYKGSASGFTSNDKPFVLNINEYKPITRDFACYPNEIGGLVSTQPLQTWKVESHPFKSGVADFKSETKYPRVIYCGNEGLEGSSIQCDNKGLVLIKGNTYPVDFYE